MQINLPDPPLADGFPVFGSVVGPHEFQGALPHGLFKTVVPDPRRLEGKLAKYHTDLAGVASIREKVQRLLTNQKKKNVEPFSDYIVLHVETGKGFTPQIVLWSPKPLRIETDANSGLSWAMIPHDMKLVALDGDTQTAARHMADANKQGLLDKTRVKIVIVHGISEEEAGQIFSDCNSKGVKVTTSIAIGLDTRDEATRLTKHVENSVPALKGRVNRNKRQLSSSDPHVITVSALRTSVVCFVQGIAGVQNQTKPVAIDDSMAEKLRQPVVTWYNAVTEILDGALSPEERQATFASAPAVWAAIGALGHDTWTELAGDDFSKPVTAPALMHALKAAAQSKLGSVNWSRADHWTVVGAKKSTSGAITLGGPKESGSLLHKALIDGTLSTNVAKSAA